MDWKLQTVLSRRTIFRAFNFTWAPDRERKITWKRPIESPIQSARPIETELETLHFVLYYLNTTYRFHF